jgi:hypothetical protein
MRGVRMVAYACVAFLSTLLFLPTAQAQSLAGVTVRPAMVELDHSVDAGAEVAQSITVTNESAEEKEYFIYIQDIKGVADGGVPVFADPGEEKTGYELSEWLHIASGSLIVGAGASVELPLTIRVPETAAPGSHFGGIFISAEPPRLREIGAGVGYEVAVPIHIRVSGDVVDTARIRSFATDQLIYGTNAVRFEAKVENQGNILIRPSGPITVRGMFGDRVQVFMANESRAAVFPGTVRDFTFEYALDGFAFGRYEAVVALVYDGAYGQKTIDASLVFWVFPAKILMTVIGVFVAVFLIGYMLTRYYIRHAIMRAAGGRRIAPQRYRRGAGISRALFVFVSLLGVCTLFLLALLVFMA